MNKLLFFLLSLLVLSCSNSTDLKKETDKQLGEIVDKFELSSDSLTTAIGRILYPDNPDRQRADLLRVQHLQTLAGGVHRAADLIEHAAWYGVNHLATADSLLPNWRFANLDVILAWLLFSGLTCLLFRSAFRFCSLVRSQRVQTSLKKRN